jgi:8-amino-7-oxononanoate synthase
MSLYHQPSYLLKALAEKEQFGLLRKLPTQVPKIDFCSNDFLGFSKLGLLNDKIKAAGESAGVLVGSTGSRLVSGNTQFIEEAEKQIALFHHGQSALIYNSGYDANLGLISCLPQKTDLILYDEQIHASMYDGIRLSTAVHYKFKHNDINALEELIHKHQKSFDNIYVLVESVYSLDGDSAPLLELTEICDFTRNIFLIVDETDAIGVFGKQGRGLCNAMEVEKKCFARIYSFGKAMGCQGAAIVCSDLLRDYLINFSRPFIYTTALPHYCIDAIMHAYQLLIETDQKDLLQSNIAYFYSRAAPLNNCIKSQSAIHSIVVGSNENVDLLTAKLSEQGIHTRPVKSPAVRTGMERLRFCLHSFNTHQEIDALLDVLTDFNKMQKT